MSPHLPARELTGSTLAPRSRWRVLIGVTLLAAALPLGCNSPGRARPVRSSGPTGPGAAERAAKDRNVILWSSPVNYHGVEVRFELPPGTSSTRARIERTEYGDRLTIHGLELSHRYQRFETAGGGRAHFEPNSRVFVFRPPSPEQPWTTVGDLFSFSWLGNGTTPVIREDRRDGSVVWTFRRTVITLTADRAVTHTRRGETQTFSTPVGLVLGEKGDILEKRTRIR